jgi:hypothetical protein
MLQGVVRIVFDPYFSGVVILVAVSVRVHTTLIYH